MPMQLFRRAVLGLMALGLTLSTLAILSCGGSDDDNETRLQANLSAANEVPPPPAPNPAGNGTAVLTISDDEQSINYTLTYAAVNNVTQAHIHVVNSPQLAGPIILFLCTNIGLGANVPCAGAGPIPTPQPCPQGSSVTITGTLTAADLSCKDATATSPAVPSFADAIAQIKAGDTYANVHSQANPAGDIRGTDVPQ
jgi:CHRD domain